MKNILLIMIASLLISGCSIFGKVKEREITGSVQVINSELYPQLPDLTMPADLNLMTPAWDVPRDTTAELGVKRITECMKVPKEDRDDTFYLTCGEYPAIPKSNIYRGYGYDEFQLFIENTAAIRLKIKEYKSRIDVVNEQRQEWRDLNAATRARVNAERAKAESDNK